MRKNTEKIQKEVNKRKEKETEMMENKNTT